MSFGKFGFIVVVAILASVLLTKAWAQASIPGPRGPVVQDRMIFFEAALLNLDRRAMTASTTLKANETQFAKLEKENVALKDRLVALEKRILTLEARPNGVAK